MKKYHMFIQNSSGHINNTVVDSIWLKSGHISIPVLEQKWQALE